MKRCRDHYERTADETQFCESGPLILLAYGWKTEQILQVLVLYDFQEEVCVLDLDVGYYSICLRKRKANWRDSEERRSNQSIVLERCHHGLTITGAV